MYIDNDIEENLVKMAVQRTLKHISTLLSQGMREEAKMVLLETLDQDLRDSSIDNVKRLLIEYDLNSGMTGAITGAMMVTKPAKNILGDVREDFIRRAALALKDSHQWDDERIESSMKRLA